MLLASFSSPSDNCLFLLAVGASADFLTPFGYQCNLMIQKPGNYQFLDYIKLGLPLTLVGLFLCPAIAMFAWPVSASMMMTNSTNNNTV